MTYLTFFGYVAGSFTLGALCMLVTLITLAEWDARRHPGS